MNPTQISELKAFVFALSRLNEPLPEIVQTKINQVNIPVGFDELHNIAVSYPPLANIYQHILGLLYDKAEYRSKGVGDIPEVEPEQFNTEVDNVSVEIVKELVEFEEKVDNKTLTKIAVKITMAMNSVQAAKNAITDLFS